MQLQEDFIVPMRWGPIIHAEEEATLSTHWQKLKFRLSQTVFSDSNWEVYYWCDSLAFKLIGWCWLAVGNLLRASELLAARYP